MKFKSKTHDAYFRLAFDEKYQNIHVHHFTEKGEYLALVETFYLVDIENMTVNEVLQEATVCADAYMEHIEKSLEKTQKVWAKAQNLNAQEIKYLRHMLRDGRVQEDLTLLESYAKNSIG